jgi:putative CocE/NonD family hydrolase
MNFRVILLCCILVTTLPLTAQKIGTQPKNKKHFTYASFYYTTKTDSTRLAVDYYLPKNVKKGEKVPTIFYVTRYVRSLRLRKFFRWLQDPLFGQVKKKEVEFFTKNGYAVVIMDARGSGASFGNRMMDFSAQEMYDGAEVIDWVVAQPWSNGRVGTTGISYLGTTSELILMTQHPAIKAAIPRSNIYDLYGDIAFPGGIRQSPFVRIWGTTTRGLDLNDFSFVKGLSGVLEGVNPVMGDTDKILLKQAVLKHRENYDVFNEILVIDYRDEIHPALQLPIDNFSIHSNIDRIRQSSVPIFRIGGWYDGALANSLFKGLWNNPNTERILVGPWDHGPHDNASPYAKTHRVKYDLFGSMLSFFDKYLKTDSLSNAALNQQPVIKYYTVGEEAWHTASTWPPQNTQFQKWSFGMDSTLVPNSYGAGGDLKVKLRYDIGTGGGSRYNSQTTLYRYTKHTGYPDRKKQTDSLFHFDTQVLDDTITITGHIQAALYASFPTEDATIFIYVDEVTKNGKVKYITEGMFRAQHRATGDNEGYVGPGEFHSFRKTDVWPLIPNEKVHLNFSLLPVSYRVSKGSKIRISFTGIDPEHFDVPAIQPPYMNLNINGNGGSYLMVPVER